MTKSNGIASLKQAARLLNKHSPDGESLAYINPDEAKLLRSHGGSGIMTLAGVPSYAWYDFLKPVGQAIKKYAPKVLDYGQKALDFFNIGTPTKADTPYQHPGGNLGNEYMGDYWQTPGINPYSTEYGGVPPEMIGGDTYGEANPFLKNLGSSIMKSGKEFLTGRYGGGEGIKNIAKDAASVWMALRAKKDQEGLNNAEMEQFNKLNQQMEAAQEEFQANIAGGGVENVPTDVSVFSETTGRPDMITTATPAEGGRIGAFNGGIQGLMPQQGMPQQGFMPQPGLDPRIGFNSGSSIDLSKFFSPNDLFVLRAHKYDPYEVATWKPHGRKSLLNVLRSPNAQGGRIGYADGLTVAEKTPLYIDPNTDLPLHNIEKEIQGMDREQRLDLYFKMLKRIESYKDIEEMDQGRKFEDLLHWGAMGGDEISGGGSGTPGMTEALEFTEHPAAEALYEKGEHYNRGGRIGAQGGGIMPLLDMGGMEKDYRQDGGFVPIGRKEKADDVPARLSKNEFVFTADAVKAAGGGDIDEGAQRMYNVMKNLEAGGEISEQSQGQG